MVAKRKIAQDNPAMIALAGALSGIAQGATSIAEAATGRGSPMGVDDEDGDGGAALFVEWATKNLSGEEMRALADALREAADAGDKGDSPTAMDGAAWAMPDGFSRRFPGSRRIGRPL